MAELSMAVIGLRWPPETFLARLIAGLLGAGVKVTVAAGSRPGREWLQRQGFSWLPLPEWAGPAPLRLVFGIIQIHGDDTIQGA